MGRSCPAPPHFAVSAPKSLFPTLPRPPPAAPAAFGRISGFFRSTFAESSPPPPPRGEGPGGRGHGTGGEEELELPRSWARRGWGGPAAPTGTATCPPPVLPGLPQTPPPTPGGNFGAGGGATGGVSPGGVAPAGTRTEPPGAARTVHRSKSGPPGKHRGSPAVGAGPDSPVTHRAGGCGFTEGWVRGGEMKPKTWASLQPGPRRRPGPGPRRPRPHLGLLPFQ